MKDTGAPQEPTASNGNLFAPMALYLFVFWGMGMASVFSAAILPFILFRKLSAV
jgi:hypothetical protein